MANSDHHNKWCLDMGLETILAVWDGEYLDGEITAQEDLQVYINDTLNELEFLLVILYPHFLQQAFECHANTKIGASNVHLRCSESCSRLHGSLCHQLRGNWE